MAIFEYPLKRSILIELHVVKFGLHIIYLFLPVCLDCLLLVTCGTPELVSKMVWNVNGSLGKNGWVFYKRNFIVHNHIACSFHCKIIVLKKCKTAKSTLHPGPALGLGVDDGKLYHNLLPMYVNGLPSKEINSIHLASKSVYSWTEDALPKRYSCCYRNLRGYHG
jgi:hypothetical protein